MTLEIILAGGLVIVRGHACNILFLDSGASYMCQVCENILSYTLIFYAFFCVSVQFSSVAQLCLTLCNLLNCTLELKKKRPKHSIVFHKSSAVWSVWMGRDLLGCVREHQTQNLDRMTGLLLSTDSLLFTVLD